MMTPCFYRICAGEKLDLLGKPRNRYVKEWLPLFHVVKHECTNTSLFDTL